MNKLSAKEYDTQWRQLDSFIQHNPGIKHRRRLMFHMVQMIKPTMVADVGCGRAHNLKWLQKCFPNIKTLIGLDFAEKTIEQNKIDFPDIDCSVLDIEARTTDTQYEFVICSEVLEHLQKQEQAFVNLANMVFEGGHLLITCPTGKIYPTQKHFGHLKHPSLKELHYLAEKNQLEIIGQVQWGWPFYSAMQYASNLFPEYTIKAFASGHYSLFKIMINKLLYYVNFLNISSNKGGQLVVLMKKKIS